MHDHESAKSGDDEVDDVYHDVCRLVDFDKDVVEKVFDELEARKSGCSLRVRI
jgi:hypothetical protein